MSSRSGLRPKLLKLAKGRCRHRNAARVLGRGLQAGVEQREARALCRKARNHFGPTTTFAVQPFQAIRRASPLMMILGKAQMGDTFLLGDAAVRLLECLRSPVDAAVLGPAINPFEESKRVRAMFGLNSAENEPVTRIDSVNPY